MKKKYILLIASFIFLLLFNCSFVFAADDPADARDDTQRARLINPLPGATPQTLIGRIIKAALGLSGSLALVMFIYGGFMWMTSAGSQEKVTKGKQVLVWATLGLVVIFSAYALVRFVFTGLGVT